ncbi:hypothetical protein NDU88_001276 [Pleurodeles waltl]|uniref:Uncharacterized protein n=1 Tax=Pleurodeles waltl TaxID=8319 RepID=A0AAV7V965_PLEWA|nr:hypothetical protein NDU88_001276 [Pleurodeles waltl]
MVAGTRGLIAKDNNRGLLWRGVDFPTTVKKLHIDHLSLAYTCLSNEQTLCPTVEDFESTGNGSEEDANKYRPEFPLEIEFSLEEVIEAIIASLSNKALGPDGILMDHKALSNPTFEGLGENEM